ncbi:MAG: lipid II-degrading bacteriocin [Alphaproteobacteria bacterium]|nr:lipid II-degrading bacteriocin [Alphaproteobacteria bacterium]
MVVQADEMFARQLDTEFANELRTLVHDPEVGLAGKEPEETLMGIAEATPKLDELKERFLTQAIGPRQRSILGPMIDSRLERATGEIGRLAQEATTALDHQVVSERLAGFGRDAALSWDDPAYLRRLGRAAVGELRYQGERQGWDASRTDATVRQGLSDLYAGAVEQAIGQDPDRAAKLYEHAGDVIQPERQAAIEQKMDRTREERRVTEIVSRLSETPDDPARRPDLDDYQARAAELTPPDVSPEVRAQVSRMAAIEHAQADRAWQAARGRAAVAAVDWLEKNPATRLLAMPHELRDGLSPAQTVALDRAVANGGRRVTDGALHKVLDGLAVRDPAAFAALDLAQHRLSLDGGAYARLVGFQKAIVEGLVGDAVRPPADDPNVVRVSGGNPAGADGSTQVAQHQEPAEARRGVAPNVEPPPGSREHEAARRLVPSKEVEGPIAGLSHYIGGSGETVEFRFKNIDTSLVKPSEFPAIKAILDRGQPGRFEVQGRMPFPTKNYDAEHFVGNITLNINGTLVLDEDGKYSFDGDLGAEADKYRFYPSTHRGTFAELLTRLGTLIPGREYTVVVPGRKAITSDGKYRD